MAAPPGDDRPPLEERLKPKKSKYQIQQEEKEKKKKLDDAETVLAVAAGVAYFGGDPKANSGGDRKRMRLDSPDGTPVKKSSAHPKGPGRHELQAKRWEEKAKWRKVLLLKRLPLSWDEEDVEVLMSRKTSLELHKINFIEFVEDHTWVVPRHAAAVILRRGTKDEDIQAAMTALKNKYLGWGCFLVVSEHKFEHGPIPAAKSLPETFSANPSLFFTVGDGDVHMHPFGAEPVDASPALVPPRGPQQSPRAKDAPPSIGGGEMPAEQPLQVIVRTPTNGHQLRTVHAIVQVVVENGPDYESYLMGKAEIIHDPKYAFLWDPPSRAGVYYKWRLYDFWQLRDWKNNPDRAPEHGSLHFVMQAKHGVENIPWRAPKPIRFEFLLHEDELVTHPDFDLERCTGDFSYANDHGDVDQDEGGRKWLTPFYQMRLNIMLASLPTSSASFEIWTPCALVEFAVKCAYATDDIVDAIVMNIWKPFAFEPVNPNSERAKEMREAEIKGVEWVPNEEDDEKDDRMDAKVIGLRLASFICHEAYCYDPEIGRHYRTDFAFALIHQRIFEHLGQWGKKLGRFKRERWHNMVEEVLKLWVDESWFSGQDKNAFRQQWSSGKASEKVNGAAR